MNVDERVILLQIPRTYPAALDAEALYEATRGVWKVGPKRDRAEYAFAVVEGEVQEVYEIESWQPAGTHSYRTRSRADVERPGRWEFTGRVAPEAIRSKYRGRRLPNELIGGQNPVRYVNREP